MYLNFSYFIMKVIIMIICISIILSKSILDKQLIDEISEYKSKLNQAYKEIESLKNQLKSSNNNKLSSFLELKSKSKADPAFKEMDSFITPRTISYTGRLEKGHQISSYYTVCPPGCIVSGIN